MKKVDFVYDIEAHEIFFFSLLPEHLKRKYAGLQAMRGGYYGVANVSKGLGIDKQTVRTGKKELIEQKALPAGRIRQKGGGRKKNFSCQKFD